MKITTGQFNDSYFPIMDGVGMTAHNYAHWLNEKHGQSMVIAPKVKGYKDEVSYNVHRFKSVLLPGMNPYRVGLPLIDVKFKKRLKKVKFDLLHAHCPFISGQFAVKLAKKYNIPLVATFHTKYRDDFKKVINNDMFVEFLMNITLDFYNAADLVWVPNNGTGETLREYGFKGPFEIMPNGTDLLIPEKKQMNRFRKIGRELIGANNQEFVMLFVGQHRWEKNVKMILEALKKLHDEGESFKMVFVGEGYATKEMKKLAVQFDLKEHVVFMGLISDRIVLEHIYAASNLFLFPSVYDNSPLVMQEAAAYEVPSVVVENTSAAEGIVDGVNGFLIENDPDDLKEKIRLLMNHPIAIKWAGKGARKTVYRPWESIVDDVHLKYVDLIRRKNPQVWRQWDDDVEPDHH